jgi:hypothetical protein
MSLVGPRPERPEFAAQFALEVPGYQDRLRVRPGITGWAQVNGWRGQTSIADRVEWDNHYIDSWSPALELRTLILTVTAVLSFREEEPAAPAPQAAPSLVPREAPAPQAAPSLVPREAPAPQAAPLLVPPEAPAPAPIELAPSTQAVTKPALTLVEPAGPDCDEARWFCGYCGSAALTPPPTARVCEQCKVGLLLEAPADIAPGTEDVFIVVDALLTVQAVSRGAEKLFAIAEADLVDHPINELISDADAEPHNSFLSALAGAARDDGSRFSTFVRPRHDFGVRIRARIGHCGPPRAALIVLESPSAGSGPRLRLVPTEKPRAARQGA